MAPKFFVLLRDTHFDSSLSFATQIRWICLFGSTYLAERKSKEELTNYTLNIFICAPSTACFRVIDAFPETRARQSVTGSGQLWINEAGLAAF